MKNRNKSRKKTPWDDIPEPTQTQRFIQMQHRNHYEQRHPKLKDTGEVDMINSYKPQTCPYCGLDSFIKVGFDPNGIRRYGCKCGKAFKPTTGTIFDSRKISVRACLVSFSARLFGKFCR